MAEAGNTLGPDLVFGGFSLNTGDVQGDGLIRFSGTVVNVGAAAAAASNVALFLSADQMIGVDDIVLDVIELSGIMPGHLIDFSGSIRLPVLPPAEEVIHLGAVVDFDDAIAEADEGNNIATAQVVNPASVPPLQPTTNIEPYVLVLRKDTQVRATSDMPTNWRVSETLPNPQYLEAARDLTSAEMGNFSTVDMADDAALLALGRGEIDAAILPRNSAVINPLPNDLVAFEIPNEPGALRPFDPSIRLVDGTEDLVPLHSSEANEVILGGDGTDVVVYAGPQSGFTLTLTSSSMTLSDRRAGGEGMDSLISIERLVFATGVDAPADAAFDLTLFTGPTSLTEQEFAAITELYIAYFNRAPDALGLFYWGTEFARGFTIQQMATSFFEQPETRNTYAHVLDAAGNLLDTDAFVAAVYANVLGRTPDPAGFVYWVDQLDNNPAITAPLFILSVIGGAKFPSSPTPQSLIDQDYLANKVDIGAYFSAIKGLSNTEDAKTVMSLFDGTAQGKDAARNAIETLYQDALDPTSGEFLFQLVGVLDDPFWPV